jgi:hypothetical protein
VSALAHNKAGDVSKERNIPKNKKERKFFMVVDNRLLMLFGYW